ncbi:MAG TPA: chloride channel core, partial [Verrucomicrobia bacterium]|nr:chloride channel core [Verrucomicrobiota bacterium]
MKSLKGFLSRHWKNILTIRQTFRFNEETIHLILAGGVGVIGGLTNACFDFFNRKLQLTLMRSEGDPIAAGNALPWWETIAIPTVGGLIAGLILYFGLQTRRSPRSGNLLEVVQAGNGKLSFGRGLLNAASSLFSISSGAPVGREGAITQLTATIASKWGQWHHWHPYRLRLLVACGAAAGMSAAYNAPIAGAVFAAQIVLGNFSMRLFGPLIFSSVIASIISRSFFGIQSRFEAPTTFLFNSLGQLPAFLVLGILSGVVGALFLKLLHGFQVGFQKIHIPIYLKIGIAGLLTGLVAVLVPEVLGNGFSPINRMLNIEIGQSYDLDYLVSLFGAKLILTAIVFSAGAVGGVFTPTLFFGACTGCLTGVLMQKLGVATDLPISVFVIVGMGSVLAATTHSALLALIMGFELSANYSLMPPLMLACAVSALVA